MNLILLAFAALPAQAGTPSIQPALEAPVCLVREYTAEHLRRNPRQKLTSVYVKLQKKTYTGGDDNSVTEYTTAAVVGQSQGQFYGNDLAGCEFAADGSAKCQIECDGGSFSLYPRPRDVLMRITKDYYFPLYKNGADPEKARPGDELSFDGNDRDNNAYSLQPVDVEQCDRAIREMRQADFGC